MRSSSLGAAIFAAGALAVPYAKREYVTDTDVHMVYVTDVVTVTAGAPQATTTAAAHANNANNEAATTTTNGGWGNWGGWSSYWGGASSTTEVYSTPVVTSASEPTSTSEPVVTVTSSPQTTQENTPQPTNVATEVSSSAAEKTTRLVDPVTASGAVPTSFSQVALYAHNLHRQNHSAPAMKWSNALAASAQIIADSCIYEHNVSVNGGGYGQNIAAGVHPANISAVVTDLFYNGEVNYFDGLYGLAQPPMTNFEFWGHFSQVVWKGSTQLGCYTSYCSNGLANAGGDVLPYFTVCNYKGPGNFANEYGINIGAPIGLPSAVWSTGLNVNNLPTLP